MFVYREVCVSGEHWILVKAKSPWDLPSPFFPVESAPQVKKGNKNVDQKLNPGDDGQRENDKERRDGQKVIFW